MIINIVCKVEKYYGHTTYKPIRTYADVIEAQKFINEVDLYGDKVLIQQEVI